MLTKTQQTRMALPGDHVGQSQVDHQVARSLCVGPRPLPGRERGSAQHSRLPAASCTSAFCRGWITHSRRLLWPADRPGARDPAASEVAPQSSPGAMGHDMFTLTLAGPPAESAAGDYERQSSRIMHMWRLQPATTPSPDADRSGQSEPLPACHLRPPPAAAPRAW